MTTIALEPPRQHLEALVINDNEECGDGRVNRPARPDGKIRRRSKRDLPFGYYPGCPWNQPKR